MCDFLSAIVLKNGDIICAPEFTDSHEDLIIVNNLREGYGTNYCENFARVEFTPPEDTSNILKLSLWELKLDQKDEPSWWDEDKVRGKLEALVSSHILKDVRKPILFGGWYILTGETHIGEICHTRIISMHDSSRIGNAYSASVIEHMHDSSKVERLYATSKVSSMCDSSEIGYRV